MTGMLDGKVALITGASSGIGEATARRFVAEGASVVLTARRLDRLRRISDELGDSTVAIPSDVTDPTTAGQSVDATVDTFGRLDILFNNSGVIYRGKTVPDTTAEEWDHTFAVNARGTFVMCKAAIPAMLRSGGGAIVNNASYFGLVGGLGTAAYAASKGAVVALTRSMALDHARNNIRVNCVCAGSVDTPMLAAEMADIAAVEGRPLADVKSHFGDKHPIGRISSPEEIAAAVTFLASDQAAFITGVALPVDGGLTAG